MGAWIEIVNGLYIYESCDSVAPLVGAWIEIPTLLQTAFQGLVAPLVGAWIEIPLLPLVHLSALRRSSRGSVD